VSNSAISYQILPKLYRKLPIYVERWRNILGGENNMEMLKAEIAGLIEQFKTIVSMTKTIKFEEGISTKYLEDEDKAKLGTIINEFNTSVHEINEVSRKLGSSFYLSGISKPDYFFP